MLLGESISLIRFVNRSVVLLSSRSGETERERERGAGSIEKGETELTETETERARERERQTERKVTNAPIVLNGS